MGHFAYSLNTSLSQGCWIQVQFARLHLVAQSRATKGWMAPVRKITSSRHSSDRFSKKHICREDGSVLVVSKKMKNIIKQNLEAQSITNMITDDLNPEDHSDLSQSSFKHTLNPYPDCSGNNSLSKPCTRLSSNNTNMHQIIKKVPRKKRRKSKLHSHFNRNENLRSTLLSMETDIKGESRGNQQSMVRFSADQSAFVNSNGMHIQKSKLKTSQNQQSKIDDNHIKEKRPSSMKQITQITTG
ncbi:unnamed protein product [Schistosoma rodhaini]|uniref:Uncharacterized protein n=1 Tax=Schistosoma rodhaini TaxID=6188 RepID=A0AA85FAV6_9TREM|nr:unnamed protein product [Schistosoma rodhaini]